VSSLPPGVRRVKYPPDILLCRLTLSPRPTCGVSHPASLASPGQTFRGLPVRPGGDSLDHRQYAVSPLSVDRIPGPVSSLPPGVRRVKYPLDILLCRLTLSPRPTFSSSFKHFPHHAEGDSASARRVRDFCGTLSRTPDWRHQLDY